jgi:hypothetical protein
LWDDEQHLHEHLKAKREVRRSGKAAASREGLMSLAIPATILTASPKRGKTIFGIAILVLAIGIA